VEGKWKAETSKQLEDRRKRDRRRDIAQAQSSWPFCVWKFTIKWCVENSSGEDDRGVIFPTARDREKVGFAEI